MLYTHTLFSFIAIASSSTGCALRLRNNSMALRWPAKAAQCNGVLPSFMPRHGSRHFPPRCRRPFPKCSKMCLKVPLANSSFPSSSWSLFLTFYFRCRREASSQPLIFVVIVKTLPNPWFSLLSWSLLQILHFRRREASSFEPFIFVVKPLSKFFSIF